MQCFVVYADKIKERFDPFSYTPQFKSFLNDQIKSKYSVKLGAIIGSGSYGVLPPSECYSEGGEILLVRATELMPDFEIDFTNSIPVPEIYNKNERARLRQNDILLAVKGATIASNKSVCFVEKEPLRAIVNGSIFRFQVKEGINAKYIVYALCFENSKRQMNLLLIANNAVNYLDRTVINNLLIPLPPLSIQNKIVDIMQSAYSQKKQMEAEVQRLLDSIDSYVLDELGIKLPEVEDKMCFVVDSEEMRDNRVDAYYYQPKFIELMEAIQHAPFETYSLEAISTKIINGLDFREFTETGIPYLRVSNIKPNSFDLIDVKFIPAFNISKDIELDSGDLLITRKGTYGIAVVVDDEHKRTIISSEIFRVVLKKENVNPHYIAIWLNSNITKQLFNRISTGAIMGHLSQNALKNIQLLLPPLEIQNKIAEEVKKRMSEAERLKAEASEIINKAKQRVEEIILRE
ncbi:MAG: restriction endonuclease subunit S [Deltaproteobacteria bacterium]|nr:restriction endonuclease subunit S [Deltaproteobacteria bacterium]